MKIEKRITEEEVKKAVMENDGEIISGDAWDLLCKWQIQTIKDQQAKEAEFEIIQPKQLK